MSYLSSTSWFWGSAVSAILGLVMGPAISWANWKYRVKPPFRRAFQISNREEITCIIPSIAFPDYDLPEYITYATPFESVFFFRTFLKFTNKIGIKQQHAHVSLSEMTSEKELDGNLFCLGGPIHNTISKALLQTIASEVRFNGHDLECFASNTIYHAEIKANKIVKDVALLVSAPNPWNPQRRVILLAGCRGYASIPIFAHICERSNIKELARFRGRDTTKRLFAVYSVKIQYVGDGRNTPKFDSIQLERAWTA